MGPLFLSLFGGFSPPFTLVRAPAPVIQSVIKLGAKVDEGRIVVAISLPWFEIVREIERDPNFLYKVDWHTMEQLVAGAYHRNGWNVTLTPRGKNDGGRDVIATRPDFGSIRIVDQIKTYKPGRLVEPADVDAMLGVLNKDAGVTKGFVTTTAEFSPSIFQDADVRRFMPNRLTLKNGAELRDWLVRSEKATGV
ncbi:MAG TPA: restriction endonuclease [Tepidisphaeraceae bacterium]|jgi:predicted Mrr-cat superfamily restriction endonuclease